MPLGYTAVVKHTWLMAFLRTLGFDVPSFYYLVVYEAFTCEVGSGLNAMTTVGYRQVHSKHYTFKNEFKTSHDAAEFAFDAGWRVGLASGRIVFYAMED